MLTLSDVKNFCRATDEDDLLIQGLMSAAESYLDGAIDNYASTYATANANWQAKADLAIKMLVCDWYENRTPVAHPANSSVDLLIVQLQLEKKS